MDQEKSFKPQASSFKQQAKKDLTKILLWDIIGLINQQKGHMQLKKNNFVVTLKTEKEVTDYMDLHIPEEQRLLWMGFFIAHNFIAHKLEEDQIELKKKIN